MENLHARLLTAVQSSQHLVLRSLSQQKWDGLRSWDDSPVVQTLKTSLLENLEFDEIAERQTRIPCAFDDTFEWVFSDHNSAPTDGERTWSSLSKWLVEGDGASIYWVTGKAGSGKSTPMKKLCQDHRTERLLAEWGGSVPVVTANFFFWCSGTELQVSQEGLLRTLLYQALLKRLTIGPKESLHSKWSAFTLSLKQEPFDSRHGHRERSRLILSWEQLVQAFRFLVEEHTEYPVKYAFFIDGLDEFSGEPSKLIALLRRLASYQNIKICVSSRPWMEFEDAFKKQPNLMMQHQTARDIAHYSRESLSKNPAFCEIATYDPKYAENLIQNIVTKASGVFLWVVLVVSSLLEGLAQGDRPSELQMRLEKLPDELDELFTKMLHGMEGQNFRDASHIFRIVHAAAEKPSLLVLSIADDDNVGWALERDVVPLETGELWYNAVRMRRRLVSRCRGLLEVDVLLPDTLPSDYVWTNPDPSRKGRGSVVPTEIFDSGPQRHISASDITVDDGYLLAASKVDYLHRTVKDFLLSSPVWDRIEAACDSGFDPHKGLFRAYLVHLKTLPEDKLHPILFGKLISLCISESRHFAQTDTSLYVRYLDELDQAAVSLTSKKGNMGVTYINRFWKEGNHHWASTLSRAKPTDNFLTVAACCDLVEYLSAKFADNPPSRELASALRADVLARSDMRSILEGRRRRGQNPCQQVLELLSQYETTKGKGPLGSNPFHNSRESRGPQPPEFDPTDRTRRASIKGVYKGRRGKSRLYQWEEPTSGESTSEESMAVRTKFLRRPLQKTINSRSRASLTSDVRARSDAFFANGIYYPSPCLSREVLLFRGSENRPHVEHRPLGLRGKIKKWVVGIWMRAKQASRSKGSRPEP